MPSRTLAQLASRGFVVRRRTSSSRRKRSISARVCSSRSACSRPRVASCSRSATAASTASVSWAIRLVSASRASAWIRAACDRSRSASPTRSWIAWTRARSPTIVARAPRSSCVRAAFFPSTSRARSISAQRSSHSSSSRATDCSRWPSRRVRPSTRSSSVQPPSPRNRAPTPRSCSCSTNVEDPSSHWFRASLLRGLRGGLRARKTCSQCLHETRCPRYFLPIRSFLQHLGQVSSIASSSDGPKAPARYRSLESPADRARSGVDTVCSEADGPGTCRATSGRDRSSDRRSAPPPSPPRSPCPARVSAPQDRGRGPASRRRRDATVELDPLRGIAPNRPDRLTHKRHHDSASLSLTLLLKHVK